MSTMDAEVISVIAGGAVIESFDLIDDQGDLITSYTNAATLEAELWAGDDQASLLTPTVEWTGDASEGRVTVTIDGDDTAGLAEGDYPIVLTVTAASIPHKTLLATIRVLDAPGVAVPLSTYCTFDDMLRLSGDLVSNLGESADQTGFVEQRHEAYLWTHETVLNRARAILDSQGTMHLPVETVEAVEITAGVDAGPRWGWSIYPDTTVEAQMADISAYLEAGQLLTDSHADRAMITANAMYALSLVYERQVSRDGNESYASKAMMWRQRAIAKLFSWVARVDRDGDGSVVLRIGVA